MMNLSPFKMNPSEVEREKNVGVPSFLPSFHEHASQILKPPQKKPSLIFDYDEDEEESQSKKAAAFKRSGTQLLRNIKEVDAYSTKKVGVVPKDIGFGLIKDLRKFDDVDFKEPKSPVKIITKKKTLYKI